MYKHFPPSTEVHQPEQVWKCQVDDGSTPLLPAPSRQLHSLCREDLSNESLICTVIFHLNSRSLEAVAKRIEALENKII